jgi:predicted MFS family arabinose efflux permease
MKSRELVIYIAAFTGPLAGNAVLALLGTLEDEWDVSTEVILLSIPAFMFPFAMSQLFSGTISDAYDRRATVSSGLAVYAIGGFLAAGSTSFEMFMVSRFVQGIGYAFVVPVLVPLISDTAGVGREGIGMGYFGSFTSAGVSAGPFLAGLLASISWRLAFVAVALVAVLVMVFFRLLFSKAPTKGIVSTKTISRQLSSAFRSVDVLAISAAGFLAFLAQIGVISFASDYLESEPMNLSALEIGIALGFSGAMGIVASPAAGRLVDLRGPRASLVSGFLAAALSASLMRLASAYWEFVALLCGTAVGSSFIWAPLLVMIVRSSPALKGTASSVFNSSRFMGYALSPLLLTPVYLAVGFGDVMLTCSALLVLGLVLSLFAKRTLASE